MLRKISETSTKNSHIFSWIFGQFQSISITLSRFWSISVMFNHRKIPSFASFFCLFFAYFLDFCGFSVLQLADADAAAYDK